MKHTALQIRPAAPVCLVMSLEPIILPAYSLACSGLHWNVLKSSKWTGDICNPPANHVYPALETAVELSLTTTSSKNLGLDDKLLMTYVALW